MDTIQEKGSSTFGNKKNNVMNHLIKNKDKNKTIAWVLIVYGLVCLSWGTRSIYVVLRDNYKLF